MNYKITIQFEIEADENKLNQISQSLEAAIENHVDLQSLVKIEIEGI